MFTKIYQDLVKIFIHYPKAVLETRRVSLVSGYSFKSLLTHCDLFAVSKCIQRINKFVMSRTIDKCVFF